jgi:hypothetical protein
MMAGVVGTPSVRRRLVVALATAAALALPGSVPATAVACPGVHRNGEVAVVDLPLNAMQAGVAVAGRAGVRGADLVFVATPRTLWRSADGGCTWVAALDLDADTTPPWRSLPGYALWSVTVSPTGAGGRTVYAVAGQSGLTATVVALPVVTYVSRDDGLHWTVHEPAPADLVTPEGRCTQYFSAVAAGPEPGTAYLTCYDSAFGEAPLLLAGPECRTAVYVTHDYAVTWQTVAGRLADPALVSAANLTGCPDLGRTGTFVVDRQAPKTLWELDGCGKSVRRSIDSGRTFAPYAEFTGSPFQCALDVRIVPGAGAVMLSCNPGSLLLIAGPGKSTAAPKPVLKLTDVGQFTGCALDPVAPRAIGLYLDGHKRCAAYAYDLLRKTFRVVGYAVPNKIGCAWKSSSLVPVVAAGSRAAYSFAFWGNGQLVRVGAP